MYTCCVCGKKHVRRPGNMYKINYDKRVRHFCGYNCYMKIIRLKEQKKHEEIREIFERNS